MKWLSFKRSVAERGRMLFSRINMLRRKTEFWTWKYVTQDPPIRISLHTEIFWFLLCISCHSESYNTYVPPRPRDPRKRNVERTSKRFDFNKEIIRSLAVEISIVGLLADVSTVTFVWVLKDTRFESSEEEWRLPLSLPLCEERSRLNLCRLLHGSVWGFNPTYRRANIMQFETQASMLLCTDECRDIQILITGRFPKCHFQDSFIIIW